MESLTTQNRMHRGGDAIKRTDAPSMQGKKRCTDGGAVLASLEHYIASSGAPQNDNIRSRKRRKVDGPSSTTDHDGEKNVIDLTSPNEKKQSYNNYSIQMKKQRYRRPVVISLVDSSDDEDDRKPAEKSALDDDNTKNATMAHQPEEENADDARAGRAFIEIMDDETYARSLALYPLRNNIAPRTAIAETPRASSAGNHHHNNTRTEGSLFIDSVEGDLTHERKQEIYADARRPEQRLKEELDNLYAQLKIISSTSNANQLRHRADINRDDWDVCKQQIERIKEELNTAQQNAAQDIYNRNNSAGRMGNMDAVSGKIVVDFHGLRVKEAISKFIEMVMPILPVQQELIIITGKGKHSRGGRSRLRDGLVAHIEQTDAFKRRQIGYEVDPKNTGKLIVRFDRYSSADSGTST